MRGLGVRATTVREWNARVAAAEGGALRMAAVKAVDPAEYPYYGELKLAGAGDARALLAHGEVLVGKELAAAFGVAPGGSIWLNGEQLRVGGILRQEPDRWAGPNYAGLRVMRKDVGGAAEGGGTLERILVLRPAQWTLEELRGRLQAVAPEALVTDSLSSTSRMNETLEWVVSCLEAVRAMGIGFALLAMVAVVQMQLLAHEGTLRILRHLGAAPRTVEVSFLVAMTVLVTPGIVAGTLLAGPLSENIGGWIENFIGPLPAGEASPWRLALAAWGLMMASAWWAGRQPRTRPPRQVWGRREFGEKRLRVVLSLALGAGMALVTIAYFVETHMAGQLVRSSPVGELNLLLLKATRADKEALDGLLRKAGSDVEHWRMIPFVRLASRNGRPGLWLVTCVAGLGEEIRVDRRLLRQMGLRVGDTLRLGLEHGELRGRVREETGLRPLDRFWQGVAVDCQRFPEEEAFWNGGALVKPAVLPAIERELEQVAPGVLTVRLEEWDEIVAESGKSGVLVLEVSASGAFLIALLLTGLLVRLASERRQREIAVLRALGASSRQIAGRLAREFARDAALACGVGVVLGNAAAMGFLRYLTGETPTLPPLGAMLGLAGGGMVLATGVALWFCRPYWQVRPMEILRRV